MCSNISLIMLVHVTVFSQNGEYSSLINMGQVKVLGVKNKMKLDVGSEPTMRFANVTCINLNFGKIEIIVYSVVA